MGIFVTIDINCHIVLILLKLRAFSQLFNKHRFCAFFSCAFTKCILKRGYFC